jgi:lysophospholipase L1-like esterase
MTDDRPQDGPPRPEDDAPAPPPCAGVAPLRTRLLGRAPRVMLWLLAFSALAFLADDLAGWGLLPAPEELWPWATEAPPDRAVSTEQVRQATADLDQALAAALVGRPAPIAAARPPLAGEAPPAGAPAPPQDPARELAASVERYAALQPLENPCRRGEPERCLERALDPFYAALRRTALAEPGAVTRITHFGDSVIIEDLWTSTVRRNLQQRFGDAGAGFLFIARPWEWYGHQDVVLKFTEAWHVKRVTIGQTLDRLYGYGGVTFIAGGPGAKATYATATAGPTGGAVSRFELYYLAQPQGGRVEVAADGTVLEAFSTAAEAVGSGFRRFELPDGPHELSLRSLGGGPVRLFGVTLEREGPGVVYDGIGILGASARALLEPDEAHWKEQFAHRRPDLVVLTFGTNESDHQLSLAGYREQLARVVARVRAVAPFAGCLLAGPPDRGDPNTRKTRPLIPKIVEVQREVALAGGCAFWDTFTAMGGANTMWRWYRTNPRQSFGDLTHLAPAGGEILGGLLYGALVQGLLEYLERH